MKKDEYRKMFEFENDYWWYRGLHELVGHYVVKLKNAQTNHPSKSEPLRIFDAGCGTGRMMELLKPYGIVEGIDYSEEAVNLCSNRGLSNARIGDLNTWNPSPETYHVIISSDVICISGVENDTAVVEKLYRALKPNGFLILNLPAFKALSRKHDIAVFVKRRYRKKRTLRDLKKIGFIPVRASYRLPPLFFIALLKKHLVERFSKKEAESDLKPLPRLINSFLLWMHRIENRVINAGIPLPVGSSLFLVCKK
jgi:2-polyprenyl-3-methyl-5-hydroxy-6-metoxy-1,4-benzoquinol methylase